MVCYEEGSTQCVILNMMPGAVNKKIILTVRPSYKVSTLFSDIKNQMQVESFDMSLQSSAEEEEVIDNKHSPTAAHDHIIFDKLSLIDFYRP